MFKKLFLGAAALLAVPSVAVAAEDRQTYNIYNMPIYQTDPSMGYSGGGNGGGSQGQNTNTYMTYPGRETYGQNYGYIPRHPGDYRDAVDRGAWTGGGGAQMPRRSYTGY